MELKTFSTDKQTLIKTDAYTRLYETLQETKIDIMERLSRELTIEVALLQKYNDIIIELSEFSSFKPDKWV